LNASDERGIDIIRNQISCFVNSKPLFENGMKFVILDEVDYMTKNAQQALRYLLQNTKNSVRFCLICNYISRIDEGLQNEFLKLHFNQLPEKEILCFLQTVCESENMFLKEEKLVNIQKLFKSDIRSMLNFMQSNQNILDCNNDVQTELNIIENKVWEELYKKVVKKEKIETMVECIHEISRKYNIDKKNLLKYFINYLIRNKSFLINNQFMNFVENIMHFQDCKNIHYINYFLIKLSNNISELSSSSPNPFTSEEFS
jgi:DNA polymerase III delta prime subunit